MGWLTDPSRVQALAAAASVILSVALLGFTWTQVRMAKRVDDREIDVALATLNAEAVKAWRLVSIWARRDLLDDVVSNVLHPDDALPIDPVALAQAAARLGSLSAQLTLIGVLHLRDVKAELEAFERWVDALGPHVRFGSNLLDQERARAAYGPEIDARIARVLQYGREAVAALNDAVNQADAARRERDLRLYPGAESEMGKELERRYGVRALPREVAFARLREADSRGWALRAYDQGIL